jgi:hypothetical protein
VTVEILDARLLSPQAQEDLRRRVVGAVEGGMTQVEAAAVFGWLDEAKIDAYEGGDLVRLGRYSAAVDRLAVALEGLDVGMVRHRSTALVDRADALAASGDSIQTGSGSSPR